ncbi:MULTISPECIES: anti-sigma factor [Asticcacaulis]|uniref:anti-sigma factor family protein n=1 Tax=Asticcacaulis TaxID=76890 RepID=UPI001AE19670|nr:MULTISPECIES: hypothetical protein [Asticcacaulis]MBP2158819.1 tellurite resistance protein [Asticcacaulis solisilvae]MDR6799865.1 tellurite resistance protein [Asticcacaulis sp. BE141]
MITAEKVVAYVDGELDEAGRAEVEAAAKADPAVAADIAAHRSLRAKLAAAFGPIIDEPVPEALTRSASTPSLPRASWGGGSAARGADGGVRHQRLTRPLITQITAMAACLVAGILLTFAVTAPRGDFTDGSGGLIARGALKQALEKQLAADTTEGRPRIGMTFRDGTGAVCRTFATASNEGLACRSGSDWRVEVAARAEAKTEFTQASSPLITQAVEARISGDVFDADAEKMARDGGWLPDSR